MFMKSEKGQEIVSPTKSQVKAELLKLNGTDNSYMFIEDDKESYIQVGGGSLEFTVEVRKMASEEEFTHWKAELHESETNKNKNIIIAGSAVQVKANQILDSSMVWLLFEAFMDGNLLSDIVHWSDMTEMFL